MVHGRGRTRAHGFPLLMLLLLRRTLIRGSANLASEGEKKKQAQPAYPGDFIWALWLVCTGDCDRQDLRAGQPCLAKTALLVYKSWHRHLTSFSIRVSFSVCHAPWHLSAATKLTPYCGKNAQDDRRMPRLMPPCCVGFHVGGMKLAPAQQTPQLRKLSRPKAQLLHPIFPPLVPVRMWRH